MTQTKKHTVTGKLIGGKLQKQEAFETIRASKLTLKASKKNKKFTLLAEDEQEDQE